MGKSVFIFLPKLHRGSHPLLSIRGAAVRFGFCGLPGVSPLSGGSGACRRWGDDNAPQGEYPEGVAPSGRFFGDFLIGEKVTRGGGAERPLMGRSAEDGAPAPPRKAPASRGAAGKRCSPPQRELHLVSLRSNPQLLLQPLHVSELAERQRHRQDKTENVRNRLAQLDAQHAKEVRQQQYRRDKE